MEHYQLGVFRFIILTHNFDFYRTLGSRMLNYDRSHCIMALNNAGNIDLKKGEYLKNVFSNWKDHLETSDTVLIASIPFIRNIVEYTDSEDSDDYILLTKILHVMNYCTGKKTKDIVIKDVEDTINTVWKTDKRISKDRDDKKIFDLIIEVANDISSNADEDSIFLEDKIALSIATRLIAEEFMIQEIIENHGNDDKVKAITSNQTGVLLSLYKECPTSNPEWIQSLEEVSLMTAENIHLNSFMYEPLIDISIRQLKNLYGTLAMIRPQS